MKKFPSQLLILNFELKAARLFSYAYIFVPAVISAKHNMEM
jgi:hypothetical protein